MLTETSPDPNSRLVASAASRSASSPVQPQESHRPSIARSCLLRRRINKLVQSSDCLASKTSSDGIGDLKDFARSKYLPDERQGDAARRQRWAAGEQDSAGLTGGATAHAIAVAGERIANLRSQGKASPCSGRDAGQRSESHFKLQSFLGQFATHLAGVLKRLNQCASKVVYRRRLVIAVAKCRKDHIELTA